jgi:hypothetical protein
MVNGSEGRGLACVERFGPEVLLAEQSRRIMDASSVVGLAFLLGSTGVPSNVRKALESVARAEQVLCLGDPLSGNPVRYADGDDLAAVNANYRATIRAVELLGHRLLESLAELDQETPVSRMAVAS